jgi:tRNA-2-methylthio-N6-dimethylallyladenosine synthase
MDDAIPEEEKSRRLEVLMQHQREIQITRYKKYIGTRCEVMVEGHNAARAQWMGRTTHNKTLNFSAPPSADPKPGSYAPVLVTGSFPNSLLGELVI